mmetsp:Transcript_17150/g.25383  ORF Transcript_17150/g.25383 Transcript_17150/m.25383 type:complete len:188 (-) Transcript_17150:33-596(-)
MNSSCLNIKLKFGTALLFFYSVFQAESFIATRGFAKQSSINFIPKTLANFNRVNFDSETPRSKTLHMCEGGTAANREITIKGIEEVSGGYVSLVEVRNFKKVTTHKIMTGKKSLESMSERTGKDVDIERFFKNVILFMLEKNMKLDNTEGMIDAWEFPVNYFTVGQIKYFHPEVWNRLDEMLINDSL